MTDTSDTVPSLDDTLSAIDALFAGRGPLAGIKPGYAPRDQQIQLSKEVARAMYGGDTLLADCPTGTGKGLAYVAAGVLANKPLVVSTATLALQAQLLQQDLPLLRKAVCRLHGYPEEEGFSFAVMKGRKNWLCQNRFETTLREGTLLGATVLQDLTDFRDSTETGDREDLEKPIPLGKWVEVASDGEDCAPNVCSYRDECFYYAHREKASSADIAVVNHALLLANAATGGNIFDVKERHLVADEAHRLEEVMAEAFGLKVTMWRVKYVMRQALKKNKTVADYTDRAEMAAELFFEELRTNGKLGSEKAAPAAYTTFYDALRSVEKLLRNDPREEVVNLSLMVTRLRRDLKAFYSDPLGSHAYAVVAGRASGKDPTRKPYPELRSWLVETGDVFREEVLGGFFCRGKVLVSATLAASRKKGVAGAVAGSFGYARERLGLVEGGIGGDRNNGGKKDGDKGGTKHSPVGGGAGAGIAGDLRLRRALSDLYRAGSRGSEQRF